MRIMTTEIYKITELTAGKQELQSVLDKLFIPAEGKAIRQHVTDFVKENLSTLRDDLYVVVEFDYVDSVYRDSYYGYFATKNQQYNKNCLRLSFFDNAFDQDVKFSNIENIKSNYLGFLILRPIYKCIGRNVISPKAKKKPYSDILMNVVAVDTSCMGVKLKAVGFPHASQDGETMTCAQTTIWALMEYYGNKYTLYCPTFPSMINTILKNYSYERQLPSSGLTYNQISVVLRQLGFGPKIYAYTKDRHDQFFENFACYIESGIPLAVAIKGMGIGHAIVCIGRSKVDRSSIIKSGKVSFSGKEMYSWNKAISTVPFVFNDDNKPSYQQGTLPYITKYYKKSQWDNAMVSHFIAPLYSKIYMEAGSAISITNYIVSHDIINANENSVIRTFLTSSRTYREYLVNNQSFDETNKQALLQVQLPKFVWVSEISDMENFLNFKVNHLLLLDATGSKRTDSLTNVLFLLSRGLYKGYDASLKDFKTYKTTFPVSFDCFAGNLK